MKSKFSRLMAGIVLIAVVIPVALAAQESQEQKQLRYTVKDLGTFGGAFSFANGINNRGWVTGAANLSGNTAGHAFLWRHGVKTDLGTLAGPNSRGLGLNQNGQVVGGADTSNPDPMGEDFCFFGTHLICLPFLWQDGAMTPLPTLGGNNGIAMGINNRGLVGGVAENSTLDSTCGSSEFQAEPVIWDKGNVQQLATVAGDPDGYVNWVNVRGDAVGASGDCWSSLASALHAVLWRNGAATDLGSLGGTLFTQASGINDGGQVIGSSDLPGDTNFWAYRFINTHAFLWRNGAITDLGTLPGDAVSFGNAINNKGAAVGNGSRAILWSGGFTDLNTLVPGPPFSPLYLLTANAINELGEIVGVGLASSGEEHAFLAVPCDDAHANIEGCKDGTGGFAAEEPIQPIPPTENPSVPTQDDPSFDGSRRRILNKRFQQFPRHYFPTPKTGTMR